MLTIINVNIDPALQNLSNPSWDTFMILFFLGAAVIYSFFVSRDRLAVVLISVYSALAILERTPLLKNFFSATAQDIVFQYRLGVFIVLFIVLFLLFSHNLSMRAEIGHHWWQAMVLSVLQVGLVMSSFLSFIPPEKFSSAVEDYFFTSDIARSIWLLAPIAAMIIMRRRDHHPSRGPMMPPH